MAQGSKIIDAISKAISVSDSDDSLPGTGCIQRGYETLDKRFDSQYGGFGNAPKFPQPSKPSVYTVSCIILTIIYLTFLFV